MNRAERRRYDRAMKHEDKAMPCRACGHMARMMRVPTGEPGFWDIHCERCGAVVERNVRLDVPVMKHRA